MGFVANFIRFPAVQKVWKWLRFDKVIDIVIVKRWELFLRHSVISTVFLARNSDILITNWKWLNVSCYRLYSVQNCMLKYYYFNTINIFTFWSYGLYQRPSSEEVCSLPLPVPATIVIWRGKKWNLQRGNKKGIQQTGAWLFCPMWRVHRKG